MYAGLTRPRHLGAFFIALDPLRFAGGATLAASLEHMARALAAQPGEVLLPGEPGLTVQAQRSSAGIPVEPGLRAEILAWSERLKVASPV